MNYFERIKIRVLIRGYKARFWQDDEGVGSLKEKSKESSSPKSNDLVPKTSKWQIKLEGFCEKVGKKIRVSQYFQLKFLFMRFHHGFYNMFSESFILFICIW